MQFKSLLFAAGLAAAAPSSVTRSFSADTRTFHLQAIRSGSDVQYAPFKAAVSNLFLNLPQSNATCESKTDDSATFYLSQAGELYLYNSDGIPQKFWVDRSGMGQGNIGYVTGDQGLPRNAEVGAFNITSDNELLFNGVGFLACPGAIQNSYGLWVSAGVAKPAGLENCVGVKARVVDEKTPVACQYTQ